MASLSLKYKTVFFFTLLITTFILQNLTAQKIHLITNDSLNFEENNFKKHTQKGNILFGFNSGIGFGLRNEGISFQNSTVLLDGSFTPKVGFLFINKFFLGLNYNFATTVVVFNYYSQYSLEFNTIGSTLRYYHKYGLFIEGQFGIGKGREKYIINSTITKKNFYGKHFTAGVGIANFWDKTINFELLIKYNNSWGDFKKSGVNLFSLNSLLLTAGIHASINRK